MPLSVGARLGPYEILAAIGAGGMGEVYKAKDTRLGRSVAIKVLAVGAAVDPERRRRFEQEARTVAALSHPNILDLHDIGQHEGSAYVVTELLEGETLAARIGHGDLTMAKAVEIGEHILFGLAAAHAKGIVHRDLKPSNVFLTTDGQVKILDFGLAKLTRADASPDATTGMPLPATECGMVMGTVGYMSPEQVRGQPADARSDIFAFGCVLYEMVSRRRAFRGETAADTMSAILSKDPPPLTQAAGVPTSLERVIRRCLEKRPEDRFTSARDVGYALRAVLASPEAAAAPPVRRSVPARLRATARALMRPSWVLPLLVVAVVITVVAIQQGRRRANLTWARTVAIPEILRLADKEENVRALVLAREVEGRLPGDLLLRDVWPKMASDIRWQVTPKGARVYVRGRANENTGWILLGSASGEPLRTPKGWWAFRFDSAGHEPVEAALYGEWAEGFRFDLPVAGQVPPGMVYVALPDNRAEFFVNFCNYLRPQTASIEPFLIDRHEVTNAEFKTFVDAAGYQRPEFWKEPFITDGRELSWEQAMGRLRDTTGQPGPATWAFGSFPEGRGAHPVTGVSWYEAAAFATFAGKRLPTVYHWDVASDVYGGGPVIARSNFSGSVAPVEAFKDSVNFRGLYDTAGNAREWCANATGELRFTLGGAADSPAYFYVVPEPRPPFERNQTTGFRCMKPFTPASAPVELERPIPKRPPLAADRAAVMDDAAWATWLRFLDYPTSPLEERTELSVDDSPWWRMEKVSFAAAYDSDRVTAYLFLPKKGTAPFQTVVYWGAVNDWFTPSSDDGRALPVPDAWDYVVKTGRALLYPVLKGTFERRGNVLGGEKGVFDARDRFWNSTDVTVQSAKDVFRSLDYLATRSDIDIDRVAMLGFSSGAYYVPLPCAVDRRIKTCLLVSGGAPYPGVLGWARRVKIPVQMVNGEYDSVLPLQESQRPLFEAFGTPRADKSHIVFPTDHGLSGYHAEMIKKNLEWLDRYLGPVR